MNSNIPPEIHEYFQRRGTGVLLVRGDTGTGKTTFAMECLRELRGDGVGVAVFPRLEDEDVYSNIQFANEMVEKGTLEVFDRNSRMADANRFTKELRTQMEEIGIGRLTILVLDTVDSIIEKFDNPHRKLKELVETLADLGIKAILVQEEAGNSYLDFLVGGIVTLNKSTFDDNRIRAVSIDKMRGVQITSPETLMTLKDGRFKCFHQHYDPTEVEKTKWKTIPDTPKHFSTGIPDMDAILDGGFEKGSYNVIDIGDDISKEEYMSMLRPMLLNFLSLHRGVVMVTAGGDHPDAVRSDLIQYMDKGVFDRYMKIADYSLAQTDKPYIMALNTSKEQAIKLWRDSMQSLRGPEDNPILEFTGLDNVEYQRGEAPAIRELLNGVAATKVSNDLGLGIIKPGLKLTQAIKNMADTYFKIVNIHGSVCVYGLKPQTPLYAITTGEEGTSSAVISLMELV